MTALSAALTLAGLVAALWHMAWWIGTVLLVMVTLSGGLLIVVFGHTQPPESALEKALKRRRRHKPPEVRASPPSAMRDVK